MRHIVGGRTAGVRKSFLEVEDTCVSLRTLSVRSSRWTCGCYLTILLWVLPIPFLYGGAYNSSGPASHLSLGVIAICSRPVVVSGSYISGVAGGRSMVCAERLNLMHMVLVVVQLIVAVLMACNIKTALFDQVY